MVRLGDQIGGQSDCQKDRAGRMVMSTGEDGEGVIEREGWGFWEGSRVGRLNDSGE